MFAVLVYDIPSTTMGTKRRNHVFKLLREYGYHVQASVFELTVDYAQLLVLEKKIRDMIDMNEDSVRVYILGKERKDTNVILLGRREMLESDDDAFVL